MNNKTQRLFKVGDLVEAVFYSSDDADGRRIISWKPGIITDVYEGKIHDYQVYIIKEMRYIQRFECNVREMSG